MQNLSKKTAFTLAEIMVALLISAIIAMLFLKAIRNGTNHYMNSLMSYSALNSLTTAAYDMAQSGCSNDDMQPTTPDTDPKHPYCDAATGFLPKWKTTVSTSIPVTDPVTRPYRGFCDRFAREEINVTGAINCDRAITNETGQFTNFYVNFTATSGARFFNFGAPLTGQTATNSNGYYTVYIDIDGKKRSSRMTETVFDESRDVDVIKFYVAIDSARPFQVIPDPDSVASNRTDYLTASVKYLNAAGTAYTYVLTGADYRTAICAADPTAPQQIINDYCTATHTYGVRSQLAACESTSGNNPCIFELDEPGMLGVRNIFNADNK